MIVKDTLKIYDPPPETTFCKQETLMCSSGGKRHNCLSVFFKVLCRCPLMLTKAPDYMHEYVEKKKSYPLC